MAWKKVKVSKKMSTTDMVLRIVTIGLGIFCMAILIYGQMVLS